MLWPRSGSPPLRDAPSGVRSATKRDARGARIAAGIMLPASLKLTGSRSSFVRGLRPALLLAISRLKRPEARR